MIIKRIKDKILPNAEIKKPEAKGKHMVKGWGKRRGQEALIYTIPNYREPSKPHEKGITIYEFKKAFQKLKSSGELTREWFNKNLRGCAKEGSCNFTTIGGIFEILEFWVIPHELFEFSGVKLKNGLKIGLKVIVLGFITIIRTF